jgi:hypothetical protein
MASRGLTMYLYDMRSLHCPTSVIVHNLVLILVSFSSTLWHFSMFYFNHLIPMLKIIYHSNSMRFVAVLLLTIVNMDKSLAAFPPDGTDFNRPIAQFSINISDQYIFQSWNGSTLISPVLFDNSTQISHALSSDPNVAFTKLLNLNLGDQANSPDYEYHLCGGTGCTNIANSANGTNVYAGNIAQSLFPGTPDSTGVVTSIKGNGDFPAASNLSVFVDITAPFLPTGDFLYNLDSIVFSTSSINQFSDSGLNTPQTNPADIYLYDASSDSSELFGTITFTNPVPIPGSIWLFGSVLAGFIGTIFRKKSWLDPGKLLPRHFFCV